MARIDPLRSLSVFGKDPWKERWLLIVITDTTRFLVRSEYCYAHLMRDVEDLEKEFPDDVEVSTFTAVVIPLLSSAIKLRKQPIDDVEFYAQAFQIRSELQAAMDQPARRWVSGAFKTSFERNKYRLYHLVSGQKRSCEQLG